MVCGIGTNINVEMQIKSEIRVITIFSVCFFVLVDVT